MCSTPLNKALLFLGAIRVYEEFLNVAWEETDWLTVGGEGGGEGAVHGEIKPWWVAATFTPSQRREGEDKGEDRTEAFCPSERSEDKETDMKARGWGEPQQGKDAFNARSINRFSACLRGRKRETCSFVHCLCDTSPDYKRHVLAVKLSYVCSL